MRWGEKAPFACLWVSWETSQKSTGSAGNMSAFYRPGAGNTRGNVTKSRRPPRGFFVFTRSFRLFPAYLFIMQAIRPPFSFSPCRKRKRSPAAKRKRALSIVGTKVPFNRGFGGTAGAYRASSKGLLAPPDAQPLTLAIIIVWRCHCRFHSVQLNGEKAENLLKRPALLCRTTRDSAMPHLPTPTAQTSAAFVRWKGDAAA